MFGRKRPAAPAAAYDPEKQRPVIRCSICTGEQVAGFRDLKTGHFHEVMLIRSPQDLAQFKADYGVTDVTKEY